MLAMNVGSVVPELQPRSQAPTANRMEAWEQGYLHRVNTLRDHMLTYKMAIK